MMFGLKVYDASKCRFRKCCVTSADTWKELHEAGFLNWAAGDMDGTPLEWALKSPHPIEPEAFDYLHTAFPETDVTGLLWQAKRLAAAKWLKEHGADPHWDGLLYPMEEIIRKNRYKESKEIAEYLYGKE